MADHNFNMDGSLKAGSFKGYDVPDRIKRIATAICERFIIGGVCDPMYIANIIAHQNGGGDGMGNFSQTDFEINELETAKTIQGRYGHNVTPEDLPELARMILFDGEIEPKAACKGLAAFTGRLRAESAQSNDQWRKDYLSQQILLADRQCRRYSDQFSPPDKPSGIAERMKEAAKQAATHNAARQKPWSFEGGRHMFTRPEKSPWGEVQTCDTLCLGVFMVSTASHGGTMVSKDMAAVLSPAARKCGLRANGFLCYEEDTEENIVFRELLDKKLWAIPDRIKNKAAYEEHINEALREHHPDYWRTRQAGRENLPDRQSAPARNAER
jgi:hypothetical protein